MARPASTSLRATGPWVYHDSPWTAVNDSASVTNSTLWGDISITQADVADNAKGDSATISGDTLGFTIPFGPYVLPRFGRVTITQGNAPGDTAVLDQDVVNNVSIIAGR